MATVSISLLREVTEILKPPRALFVPFKMGFPLGEPNHVELQQTVIKQGLALFDKIETPLLVDFV